MRGHGAAFHWDRRQALIDHALSNDLVRAGEGFLDISATLLDECVGDIAVKLGMYYGRVRLHSSFRIDHRRKGLIFYLHQIRGIPPRVSVRGDDRNYRLAHEADRIHGERGLKGDLESRYGGRARDRADVAGNILARQHLGNSSRGSRGVCFDRYDVRVCVNAADKGDIQHPVQLEVIDVCRSTRNQPPVLRALHREPHCPGFCLGCRSRLGHGLLLSSRRGSVLFAQLASGVLDRADNVLVTGTAAEIPIQPVADFALGWIVVSLQELACGHDHAWRAESALQPVLFPEAFLQGVEFAVMRQAFDRGHRSPVRLNRQDRAGLHGLPVQQDRAGAANAGLAADVCAGQTQRLSKVVHKKQPRLDSVFVSYPVHLDAHLEFHDSHLLLAPLAESVGKNRLTAPRNDFSDKFWNRCPKLPQQFSVAKSLR